MNRYFVNVAIFGLNANWAGKQVEVILNGSQRTYEFTNLLPGNYYDVDVYGKVDETKSPTGNHIDETSKFVCIYAIFNLFMQEMFSYPVFFVVTKLFFLTRPRIVFSNVVKLWLLTRKA